jgi:type VII secretion-associated protein (TIGR03931 family)
VTVVEVGPATVRGPNPVDNESAGGAVEAIDDATMLVGDQPVAVRAVMADLLRSAAGDSAGDVLTVVHPSWWSERRVAAVLDAARDVCGAAVALTRSDALGGACDALVEIAAEHVAVISAGICTITRTGDDAVCAAVVHEIGFAATVVVDAPPGVGGAALAVQVAATLRERGAAVTLTGTHPVRTRPRAPVAAALPPGRSGRRRMPVLAGVLVAAAGFTAAAVTHDSASAPAEPTTLLVEGRVGVVVPALWAVQRVTEGRGSARVQITSPANDVLALHVTQSALPHAQSLEQMAATLRDALDAEPAGVFTDFHTTDQRGGRAVATYRERRANHETQWAVLVDDTVRIGIGCQSPPGNADAVRAVCDAAVQSAHAVF